MSKVLDVLLLSKQRTKLVNPLASCEVFSCVAGNSVGQKKRMRVLRHQSIGRCFVCFCLAARAASSSSSAWAARSCCSSLAKACASNFCSTNLAGGGRVGVSRTKQFSLLDGIVVGVVATSVSSVFSFLALSVDLDSHCIIGGRTADWVIATYLANGFLRFWANFASNNLHLSVSSTSHLLLLLLLLLTRAASCFFFCFSLCSFMNCELNNWRF